MIFRDPLSGQAVTANDDLDVQAPHIQTDVVVDVIDAKSGEAVDLESVSLSISSAESSGAFAPWSGPSVVEGGHVTFPRVTLPPQRIVIQVVAIEAGTGIEDTSSVTVDVGADPRVEIVAPAAGSLVNASGDADPSAPGFQIAFDVSASGLAGASGTIFCEDVCGVKPTAFTVAASDPTRVLVTLEESACELGPATCRAVVANRAGQNVESAPTQFQLDTSAPVIELAEPSAAVASRTFRVAATVGCAEDGMNATLSQEGEPPITATVSSGAVVFPSVSVQADGIYSWELLVADRGGNTARKVFEVVVDSDAPTLALSVPSTVTADGNANLEDGIQAYVIATVGSELPGTDVSFWASVTGALGARQVEQTAPSGSVNSAVFEVNLAEGPNSVRVCVENLAGVETCEARTVVADLGRPLCRITSPAYNEHRQSTAAASVIVDSPNGPVEVAVRDASSTLSTWTGTAVGGKANVPVTMPTPDGEYFLVATCPGGGVSQRLPLVIDGTPPAIEVVRLGGQLGSASPILLGPDTPDRSLEPGVQVELELQSGEVETAFSASFSGCATTATASGSTGTGRNVILRGLTLPSSGTCELLVTAFDLAGNSATATRTVKSALSGGSVGFVAPMAGSLLGPADGAVIEGGGLTLANVRLSAVAAGPGTVVLSVNGQDVGTQAVAAGTSEVGFAAVALAEGVNVLHARMREDSGMSSCAVARVVVRTLATPALVLTNPPGNATFNFGNDFGPEVPGIQRPLSWALVTDPPAPGPPVAVDICTDVPVVAAATPCRGNTALFTLLRDAPTTTSLFTYPDGKYSIRAVAVDGTQSDPVNLFVDGLRPRVTAVTFAGDDGDRILNLAELPLNTTAEAIVVVEGAEDGQPVHVRTATGVLLGSGTVASSGAVVALSGLPKVAGGLEAEYPVVVVVVDAAGNPNNVVQARSFDPLNDAAILTLRVDQVAPAIVVTKPARTALGLADDCGAAAGFQLCIEAVSDADASAITLTRGDGSTLTVPQPTASYELGVPAGTQATEVFLLSATDSAGNVGPTLQLPLLVDLVPPQLTIVQPANGSQHNTSQLTVTVNVTGAEGAQAVISTSIGGTSFELGRLTVASGVASGPLYFPNGAPQTVSATVLDSAGNPGTASVSIGVQSPGCSILITQPTAATTNLNASQDADGNPTNGAQFTLAGSTTDCRGLTATLTTNGANPTTAVADPVTGAFSFGISVLDGQQDTFVVSMTDSFGQTNSVQRVISADLTPPGIQAVTPSANPLFIVAASNVNLFPTPAVGYVVDQVAGGSGQFQLSFTASGAQGGTARVLYGSGAAMNVLHAQPLTTSQVSVSLPNFTLPHDSSGTLRIEVEDASGNVFVRDASATVDVQPPAPPPVSRTLSDARNARVDVSWSPTGDDGTTGAPAGYDLRWTTDLVAPGGLSTDAAWFDLAKNRPATTGLISVAATSFSLSALPPINTYWIHLRAVDEVGNYSPLVTSGASVANAGSSISVSNPGSGAGFGWTVLSADLDGGGKADLIVGAPSGTPGYVYVYYGENGVGSGTPQSLSAPDVSANWFGHGMDVGNAGDALGEGLPDLLVGSMTWNPGTQTNRGRAFLHFGRSNQQLDPNPIEFRGTAGAAAGPGFFGRYVAIVNDINGDGLREVVISAPNEVSSGGRVYLWYGRTTAQWATAKTGSEGGVSFVPTSSADHVFEPETGALQLGRNDGFASLGDADGDGTNDFTVPSSRETVNKVYVHSGATVKGKTSAVLASDALQILSATPGTSNLFTGFGASVIGGANLVGAATSGKDIAVAHPGQSRVYLYAGAVGATPFAAAPSLTIISPPNRNFGVALEHGDYNGDGRPDLGIGESVNNGCGFLFFHTGQAGSEFDVAASQGFSQARICGNALGGAMAFGDFDGDGKIDWAVGDNLAGSVTVRY